MVGVVYVSLYVHLPMVLIYLITLSTGWPFLIAGPIFALLADKYGVQMVGAASAHFEGFGTGGGAFALPLILGGLIPLTGSTIPWVVIAVIYFVIFIIWMFQKEYTVSKSMVDVDILNAEKLEKKKEFGLE